MFCRKCVGSGHQILGPEALGDLPISLLFGSVTLMYRTCQNQEVKGSVLSVSFFDILWHVVVY